MVEKVTSILRWLGVLLGLIVLPCNTLAHRLDEYLQAALVVIEPGAIRLQLNLTPGVTVADQVIAQMDRNHDGVISTNEASAYAESVKHQLLLTLDQHKVALNLTASSFPPTTELQTGWGIIQLEFSGTIRPLSAGPHKLTLKNRHLSELSVFLINAAQPKSGLVQIVKQTRNDDQSAGEIEFVILQPEKSSQAAQETDAESRRAFGPQGH
jgi:hypothetical protein